MQGLRKLREVATISSGTMPSLIDLALVIQVVDEEIQRRQPLHQAGGDAVPFLRGDDPRNDVEGPGAVDVLAFAVDREGDAHLDDGALGSFLAGLELLGD